MSANYKGMNYRTKHFMVHITFGRLPHNILGLVESLTIDIRQPRREEVGKKQHVVTYEIITRGFCHGAFL